MKDFGLYLIITKPTLSYQEIAKIAVKNNIEYLQLREKHLNDKEVLEASKEILAITKGTQTKYIINDRADLALLADADGVHLGQDDISYQQARAILGEDKIIGLSTHSLAQAKAALAHKPDYIGFGPIYPTPTKAIADPAVGLDYINEVVALSDIPVVAIGGIDDTNAEKVIYHGAKNICLVRYFMNCDDLEHRILKIRSMLHI
jgi:thiamine-phosphate pyrophosphorylase